MTPCGIGCEGRLRTFRASDSPRRAWRSTPTCWRPRALRASPAEAAQANCTVLNELAQHPQRVEPRHSADVEDGFERRRAVDERQQEPGSMIDFQAVDLRRRHD